MGIGEEFKIEEKIIRLSIGCEEHEDLIQDLDQAMTAAFVSKNCFQN
jgi:cystathionine beta-lyase/cystathionine gamma-synthase